MNFAMLCAEGTDQALQALREVLDAKPDFAWNKDDPTLPMRPDSSGFTATLAIVDKPRELIGAVRPFLARCKERGLRFSDNADLTGGLALCMAIGEFMQYGATLRVHPADSLLFATVGLEVEICVTPSDEVFEYVRAGNHGSH